MRVPLVTPDFLDRAAFCYPARTGVVDEPGALPGRRPRLARPTAELAERAAALAAGLDELGVGRGERVAVVSHNSARLLELFFGVHRVGPGARAGQLPAVAATRSPTSSSTAARERAARRPRARRRARRRDRRSTGIVLGKDSDAALLRSGVAPQPWDEADEDATATINYTSRDDGAPQGRADHAPQHLAQRRRRSRCTPAVTDRDVYLHTLPMFHANGWGMPFAMTGLGVPQVVIRKIDGAEILRRVEQYGVTVHVRAPAVVASVLEAARDLGGRDPGPRPDPGHLRRCAAAQPDHPADRGASSGWEFLQIYGLTETSPLLTVNRRRPEEDDAAARGGVAAAGPGGDARARLPARRSPRAVRCWPAATSSWSGYWQQPDATRGRARGRLVPHRGRRLGSTTRAT